MLSVVIPSYNDAKNITLAIASANQIKYVNEIIIVDDCSSDNTKSINMDIKVNCKYADNELVIFYYKVIKTFFMRHV